MQPTNNINDPNGMDELLKQAFLDLDMSKAEDSKLMDQVAAEIMQKDWPKGNANNTKSNVKKVVKVKPWTWILSGLAGISLLSIGAIYLLSNETADNVITENTNSISNEISLTNESPVVKENSIATDSILIDEVKTSVITEATSGINNNSNQSEENQIINPKKKTQISASTDAVVLSSYVVNGTDNLLPGIVNDVNQKIDSMPVLVETKTDSKADPAKPLLSNEELEAHKKEMKKMMDSYNGMHIEDYSYIAFEAKKKTNLNPYYLKKGEVSIGEYKLFLTDLLAKGRAEDYKKAKPDLDKVWTDPKDKRNKALLQMYFKKENYVNYPVVCVSKDAMLMYCKWLENELAEFYKSKGNTIKFKVRLPSVEEWKYAGTRGNPKYEYATINGKIKKTYWNHFFFFHREWNANFIEAQPKFVSKTDTLDDSIIDHKGPKTTDKLNKEAFTHMMNSHLNMYNSLYNMSGNVSEMVSYTGDDGKTKYRTIGGNWNSNKEYLKVNANDEFEGKVEPSPYVGFRPVIEVVK